MAERRKQSAYSRWRKRRRIERDARQLTREARRILRKHGHRVKEAVAEEIDGTILALRVALREKNVAQMRERLERLDELVDRHLAFGRKSALREYTESIGIAVLVALLLRAFVVEAFKIPSGSMIPTLEVGDHLFVNKFIYGLRVPFSNIRFVPFKDPKRGEVIVFVYPRQSPHEEAKDFIKRIVAVGGDTIAFRHNVIHINGQPIPRRQLPGPCVYPDIKEGSDRWEPTACVAYEEQLGDVRYRVIQDLDSFTFPDREPMKIPQGTVFVMGDNRDNSHDSRFWGTVPVDNIKGRAMVIWWSYGQPSGVRFDRFFHRVHGLPSDEPVQP